ncbi:hypothetical protein CALVIDRAFT_215653 [Calocera viscosa TUFC12733]|uniref:Uncharacterized protein n=1 Tax=Calocera viscosa (strain TUFC12733) TaxID=1330018 RepID=A0A167RFR2_CALVF|nr:hypothetical protein CALVIDRAFT_215653 [Calocera viscosa TUFC12733]
MDGGQAGQWHRAWHHPMLNARFSRGCMTRALCTRLQLALQGRGSGRVQPSLSARLGPIPLIPAPAPVPARLPRLKAWLAHDWIHWSRTRGAQCGLVLGLCPQLPPQLPPTPFLPFPPRLHCYLSLGVDTRGVLYAYNNVLPLLRAHERGLIPPAPTRPRTAERRLRVPARPAAHRLPLRHRRAVLRRLLPRFLRRAPGRGTGSAEKVLEGAGEVYDGQVP